MSSKSPNDDLDISNQISTCQTLHEFFIDNDPSYHLPQSTNKVTDGVVQPRKSTARKSTGGRGHKKLSIADFVNTRTKQTARKSTGGKTHRRLLMPENNRQCVPCIGGVGRHSCSRLVSAEMRRQILRAQLSHELVIKKLPFVRLVREIAQNFTTDLRFQSSAIELLHVGSEQFLVGMFQKVGMLKIHAINESITPMDINVALTTPDSNEDHCPNEQFYNQLDIIPPASEGGKKVKLNSGQAVCQMENAANLSSSSTNVKRKVPGSHSSKEKFEGKFVIKMGLSRMIFDERVQREIDGNVAAVSNMAVMVGIFVDWCLHNQQNNYLLREWSTNGPNFLAVSYFMKDVTRSKGKINNPEIRKLWDAFKKEHPNIPQIDGNYRSAIFQELAVQLKTNFKNNLIVHAWARIKKVLGWIDVPQGPRIEPSEDEERDKKQKKIAARQRRARRNLKKRKKRHQKLLERRERKRMGQAAWKRKKLNEQRMAFRRKVYTHVERSLKNANKFFKQKMKRRTEVTIHRVQRSRTSGETAEQRKERVLQLVQQLKETQTCDHVGMRRILENNPGLNFNDVENETEYHKFIPFFLDVKRFFDDKNLSNFCLVPQAQLGRRHIILTNSGLADLETRILLPDHEQFVTPEMRDRVTELENQLGKKKRNRASRGSQRSNILKALNEAKKEIKDAEKRGRDAVKVVKESRTGRKKWSHWFNLPEIVGRLERRKKGKFSGSLTTDGVSVCLIFNRKMRKEEVSFNQTDPKDFNQDREKVFESYTGIDPGVKYYFTGATRKGSPQPFEGAEPKRDQGFAMRASTFRWLSQEYKRNLSKKVKANDPAKYHRLLLSSQKFSGLNMNKPSDIVRTTEYRMKVFLEKQDIMQKRGVSRVKFDKYILRQREIDLTTNLLIGNLADTSPSNRALYPKLLVMGQPQISKYMPGKRCAMLPVCRRIVERVREAETHDTWNKVNVSFVDEHRTTKLCSNCNRENQVSGEKERSVYCSNCQVHWHRDVNAARNILNLGAIRQGVLHMSAIKEPQSFRALNYLFPGIENRT